MKLARFLFLVVALSVTAAARATTVIPPTFDQLVHDAQLIFEGTVTSVESQWAGEGNERRIVSFVTFKVNDTIKGDAGDTFRMQMLGGTVGDETMQVADAPRFKTGDHDILFVENNGTQFIPLVGIMHGRMRIQQDASGRDVVLTNEGLPLADVSKLGTASASSAVTPQMQSALTPAAFKAAIKARLGVTQ